MTNFNTAYLTRPAQPLTRAAARVFFLVFTLLALLPARLAAKVGGLAFLNPANSIEHRTSYSVFGNRETTFHRFIDISFDMRLPYREEVGYIVRLIDRGHSKMFNLFFDGRGNDYFALNREGYKGLLLVHYDRNALRRKQWFPVRVRFDMERGTVTLDIDGRRQVTAFGDAAAPVPLDMKGQIVFGRSDYLIDVPSFAMRNLRVADSRRQWTFPLKQTAGSVVRDEQGRAVGTVTAPYWLLNDHYHWKPVAQWASATPAGHNYDAALHRLLYYNRDSLFICDAMSGLVTRQAFAAPCPVQLYLGTSFVDPAHRRLYTYETFRERKAPADFSVASLDLDSFRWRPEATVQIDEGQMHHHGAFFRPDSGQFTIYGGFANMRYNSRFYTYDIASHRWIMLNSVQGERFPRYFLSMGFDGRRYAYIFGGMGNESGDQTVGRRFFYDLHRYDTRTQRVDKLWNVSWGGRPDIVFARSMVLTRDSFYTLGYSEFKSNSYVRLYRFSLRDGGFCQLGDSILIHPDRIETETTLYYDSLLHRFIAAVQEYRDERHSTLRTYALDAPAIDEATFDVFAEERQRWPWLLAAVGLLAACGAGGFFGFRRLRRRRATRRTEAAPVASSVRPNSVCLFGSFAAFDRSGRDISYMFTDKLRLLFCIILEHSAQGGISSQRLGYEMWGDKSPEKIKNSKSVAINHLRKALKELDGVSLDYASGCFQLHIAPPFYCDYVALARLLSDDSSPLYDRRAELFEVLDRGKFLAGTDAPVLDGFKASVEELLLKPLNALMEVAAERGDYSSALHCVRYIFYIDPVNEPAFHMQTRALKRLGRTLELQEAVIHFNEVYKKIYGESRKE